MSRILGTRLFAIALASLIQLGCPMETSRDDHANSNAGATMLTVDGATVYGQIEQSGDIDYFRFSANSGQQYEIETHGSMDTIVALFGTDGTSFIAFDDNGGPGNLSRIEWDCSSSGIYFVRVGHRSPNSTGSYSVGVTGSQSQAGALTLNQNSSSDHVAHVALANGTEYDFWVQRDAQGAALYVSDIRMSLYDGTEIYAQVDALGRPSFARSQSGYELRVHFYLEGGLADVSFTDPYGRTRRGIMDAELLAPGVFRGASSGGFTKGEWLSAHPEFAWAPTKDASETICDLVYGSSTLFGIGSAVHGVVVAVGCVSSIAFDVATFPTIVESLAGCAFSYALATAASYAIVQGAQALTDLALDCNYETRYLGEDQAPEDPPTTGEVEVGGGEVHVTLTWDNATDVDLHVTDPAGEEIYYAHPYSASGAELDVDDTNGYGPENIFWPPNGAPSGQYVVEVVYYWDYGRGPSDYHVTVRYGSTIREYSGRLNAPGERDYITTFSLN